jgi:hypothetical protein
MFHENKTYVRQGRGGAFPTGQQITLEQFPEAAGARSYLPGNFVPDYTLDPPTPDLTILGNATTVSVPTTLSTLLQPGMGNVVWAACLVVIGW